MKKSFKINRLVSKTNLIGICSKHLNSNPVSWSTILMEFFFEFLDFFRVSQILRIGSISYKFIYESLPIFLLYLQLEMYLLVIFFKMFLCLTPNLLNSISFFIKMVNLSTLHTMFFVNSSVPLIKIKIMNNIIINYLCKRLSKQTFFLQGTTKNFRMLIC